MSNEKIKIISDLVKIYFFQSHLDHRDLHSFPTRRSSDLSPPGPPPELTGRPAGECGAPGGSQFAGRSEEHTSELQSQSNLVCRLLLEKKKDETKPVCSLSTTKIS